MLFKKGTVVALAIAVSVFVFGINKSNAAYIDGLNTSIITPLTGLYDFPEEDIANFIMQWKYHYLKGDQKKRVERRAIKMLRRESRDSEFDMAFVFNNDLTLLMAAAEMGFEKVTKFMLRRIYLQFYRDKQELKKQIKVYRDKGHSRSTAYRKARKDMKYIAKTRLNQYILIKNAKGNTAVDLAKSNENEETMRILIKRLF